MEIKHLLFLAFAAFGVAQEESLPEYQFLCNELESKSKMLQLKRYLFCEYDQSVRPTERYKNATVVQFGLLPQMIDVDFMENTAHLHTWTSFEWKDEHLTWDPANYDNIKMMRIHSYEIWVPDIAVHNAGAGEVSIDMPITHCLLFHMGDVFCVPSTVYTAKCQADGTWWPYDTRNCTIRFGSWSHSENEIMFRFLPNEIDSDNYEENLAWELLEITSSFSEEHSKFHENSTTVLLTYHIILRRHASPYSFYKVSVIVLVILTLTTLWLEPKSTERMVLANMNFLGHMIYMYSIHWRIPDNQSSTPKLILLHQNSLILASLSLILTSALRHLQETSTEPPIWISSRATSIIQSKIGQILLMSVLDPKVSAKIQINADDNAELVSSNRKVSGWQPVVILIGWVAFIMVLIAYVVLLTVYLPTSTSGNPSILNS